MHFLWSWATSSYDWEVPAAMLVCLRRACAQSPRCNRLKPLALALALLAPCSDGDAFVGEEMAARIATGGPSPLPEDAVAKTGFGAINLVAASTSSAAHVLTVKA